MFFFLFLPRVDKYLIYWWYTDVFLFRVLSAATQHTENIPCVALHSQTHTGSLVTYTLVLTHINIPKFTEENYEGSLDI